MNQPKEKHPITILLVDDHPVFRQGLRQLLALEADLQVLGEVSAGDEALSRIAELKPDVVILDVNIPKINGIQVAARSRAAAHSPAIIMITAYNDRDQAIHAIRAGAASYCSKDIEVDKLVQIIHNVAKGLFCVEGQVYDKAGIEDWITNGIASLTGPYVEDPNEHFVPLSPREMEILRHVTLGSSNQEIAYQLKISHQTVKNHMTSILRKLDVQDRTQAAVYAIAHGWVSVNDALGEAN
jgi:DNA-binding NarL/FixJ family response regulator